MKKITAFLLAAVLALSLAACGGKRSNVSIRDFEETILQRLNSDASLTTAESDGGYTFQFSGSLVLADMTVSGTAGKEQMVEKATVTLNGVPENYFEDVTAQSIQEDVADWEHVPMNRLAADFLISAFAVGSIGFAGGELSAVKTTDCLNSMLSALDEPKKDGGWTYTMDLTGKVLTITMEYTG